MRIINKIVGLAMMGLGGSALASEPIKLDAASLDSVTAGLYDVGALAFAGRTIAIGASTRTTSITQFRTFELITLSPPNFAVDAGAFASVQSQVEASGVGTTSASNSGLVISGVRPSIN